MTLVAAGLLFGYMFLATAALAVVPHEPMVIWAGREYGIWSTALVATAATLGSAWVDAVAFGPLMRRLAHRPILTRGAVGWVRRRFGQAPFVILALSGVTPLPAWPVPPVRAAGVARGRRADPDVGPAAAGHRHDPSFGEDRMETAKRELTFLLAGPERRLLRAIAARLPLWVVPDHLTLLGVLGAFGSAAAYALSGRHMAWLWVASAMVIVNWFGDSLDGTTARVRKIERPKYGYYLDHMVDGIITAAIGVGIGLSPFVRLDVALVLVVVYLVLSINVYLEAEVFDVFEMGYGPFGPTEVRLLIILANTGLWAGATFTQVSAVEIAAVANWVLLGLAGLMALTFLLRFRINLIRLTRAEPPRKPGA